MRFLMIFVTLAAILMALPIAGAAADNSEPDGFSAPESRETCTATTYDNLTGVIYAREADGAYSVWGDCNASSCQKITTINPNNFVTITTLRGFRRYVGSSGWYIDAYYMGAEGVAQVYQLNVYNGGGILQEDGYWVYMYSDGTTAWKSERCTSLSSAIRVTATFVQTGNTPTLPTNPTTMTPSTMVTHSTGDSGPSLRAAGTYANGIYTIAPGDNLYRISLRFGVSMQAIIDANGIANMNLIYAGQWLHIP